MRFNLIEVVGKINTKNFVRVAIEESEDTSFGNVSDKLFATPGLLAVGFLSAVFDVARFPGQVIKTYKVAKVGNQLNDEQI